jgi:chemotaxis protein MotA
LIVGIATLFGILGACALIITTIVLAGSPYAFIDILSICIVIGGTFSVSVACNSFHNVGTAFINVMSAVFYDTRKLSSAASFVLQFAELSRRKGLLAMKRYVSRSMNEKMLHKCLKMLLDGSPRDKIQRMMRGEMQAAARRHLLTVGVLHTATEISPTMGLIITLVGLGQMLGDQSTINPSMAVALLVTFFGAVMANTIFPPFASKLKRNSSKNFLINQNSRHGDRFNGSPRKSMAS